MINNRETVHENLFKNVTVDFGCSQPKLRAMWLHAENCA